MIEFDLTVVRGATQVQAALVLGARGISAVIGRSGAGKTTLLHAIAGLARPSRGFVRVGGRTLFDSVAGVDLPAHRRAVGLVFQDGRLFPHRSVRGNLEYGARLAPPGDGPRFDDVVSLLGIGALLDRRPHLLSGGERQRVAIGRALLARPRALLLDEPLASLDPPRRHELLGYLALLPQRFAMPLVYVTHQTDEVLRLADHLVVLDAGCVVAEGPALELLGDPALQPHVGRFDAGSVLAGTVAEQLDEWHLTRVAIAGQRITVPQLAAECGRAVRLRVRARDVALQREVYPTSASNQLQGRVLRLLERDGPFCAVEVALRDDAPAGERLWALVTRRSVHGLGIAPGQPVVAAFKAVAVEGRAMAMHDEAA